MKTKIAEGGRIVIPAAYRKRLGLKPGDDVTVFLEGEEIRIAGTRQVVARAQNLVRRYTTGRKLSDELIRERRSEAKRE